jgi:hypothetical protein
MFFDDLAANPARDGRKRRLEASGSKIGVQS